MKNEDKLTGEDDLSIKDEDIEVSRDEESTIRLSLNK